jgi:hypothetical protein
MWLVAHNKWCSYSEGPERESAVHKPYKVPYVSDCSAGVTNCYSWAGAQDPNGDDYRGGYTGTLIARGKLEDGGKTIRLSRVRSADLIFFGPATAWHVAMVIKGGKEPLLWSMGEQGDPRLYPLSAVWEGVAYANNCETSACELRAYRYNTRGKRGPGKIPVQKERDFVQGTIKKALA